MTTEELSDWVHCYADREHPNWQACSVTIWPEGKGRARTVTLNARRDRRLDHACEGDVKRAITSWAAAQGVVWTACSLAIRVGPVAALPSETLLVTRRPLTSAPSSGS